MKNAVPFYKRFIVVIFTWLCSIFSLNVYAQVLKVGDVAPSFELVNQNGDKISLTGLNGQWVVLYFYPKDDTPGCTTEACSFRDNINRLIAQNAKVIGVSLDSQKSHAGFAKKYSLPFDLLADESGEVTKAYGSLLDLKVVKFAKRHSFIISPDGKISKIYRDVNPDEHVYEVMDTIKELQSKAG